MKFIASSSVLLKHLNALNGVIPSNPIVPILDNFLFEIKSGILEITASDLKTSVISRLSVESDEDGDIAIPARILVDTLKNLPEQPLTFHIGLQSYSIEISSDSGKYKLTGESAADFPKVPDLGKTDTLQIPTDTLSQAIDYTLFATSTDEMKPAMNGVFFEFTEKSTHFVASNGHRLVCYKRQDLLSSSEAGMIIDRKALNLLRKSLPTNKETVTLEFNASNAVFSFADYRLISRLIDERFPDYNNAIPLNNENKITVDRMALLGCLRRSAIYANQTTKQIKLLISENEIRITAEDLEFSNEASERIFCEYEGEDIEIGFNAKLFIEILHNIQTERIILKLSEPSRAGLVVPEENGEDEDLLMLIMPIMLHSYN